MNPLAMELARLRQAELREAACVDRCYGRGALERLRPKRRRRRRG